MQTSVIIPTCNRAEDLQKTLNSLLEQSITPTEIIVVDDSDNKKTEIMLKDSKIKLQYKYIKKKKEEKSGAISRNIGIKNATGDILFFFDDDIILDRNYIKEILKVYEEYPDTVGVQGYIVNRRKSIIKNTINQLFFLVHSEKNRNRLLPSMQNVYADPLDKIINCQWMVSNNFSFKKEILSRFNFDEKLKKSSASEDDDLSYRIYKQYTTGLYQTPFARLEHKGSSNVKEQPAKLIFLAQVYHLYLFYKDIKQSMKNKLILLWSRIGLLLIAFGATALRLQEAKALRPLYLMNAYAFCIRNLNKIKAGNIEFFNKML